MLSSLILGCDAPTGETALFSPDSGWSLFDAVDLIPPEGELPGFRIQPGSPGWRFLKHYRFEPERYVVSECRLQTSSGRISVLLIEPPKSANTGRKKRPPILFVHGYLDHAALNAPFLEALVLNGFSVVAPDLPGHGRSDGFRGTIDHFSRYGEVLGEVRAETARLFGLEPILVGHSTGCAAIMEMLDQGRGGGVSQVVMAAPLVRTWMWGTTRWFRSVSYGWLDSVPRRYTGSSLDEEYLQMVQNRDFLGFTRVPGDWSDANAIWVEDFLERAPKLRYSGIELLLMQGGSDTVVDAAFNVPRILDRFERSRLVLIEGGRHGLFHEEPAVREQVIAELFRFILP